MGYSYDHKIFLYHCSYNQCQINFKSCLLWLIILKYLFISINSSSSYCRVLTGVPKKYGIYCELSNIKRESLAIHHSACIVKHELTTSNLQNNFHIQY